MFCLMQFDRTSGSDSEIERALLSKLVPSSILGGDLRLCYVSGIVTISLGERHETFWRNLVTGSANSMVIVNCTMYRV